MESLYSDLEIRNMVTRSLLLHILIMDNQAAVFDARIDALDFVNRISPDGLRRIAARKVGDPNLDILTLVNDELGLR